MSNKMNTIDDRDLVTICGGTDGNQDVVLAPKDRLVEGGGEPPSRPGPGASGQKPVADSDPSGSTQALAQ